MQGTPTVLGRHGRVERLTGATGDGDNGMALRDERRRDAEPDAPAGARHDDGARRVSHRRG